MRLNSAHGTAANVCPIEDDSTMTLMKAAIKAAAGKQLRWDYVAVTDDQNDPLNARCKCRGRRCKYKELNHGSTIRYPTIRYATLPLRYRWSPEVAKF